MSNSIDNLDVSLIILSYVGKSIKPRFIISKSVYPITIQLPPLKCVFGVDKVFDKSYIKLAVSNDTIRDKLLEIENRLKKLILDKENLTLESSFYGDDMMVFMLDKDIKIRDGKSIFGLTAGTMVECEVTLGNIYIKNSECATYKWIVNKLSFV